MRLNLYERVIAHYGKQNQMHIAIEEMSELTKELCKNERGEDNREKIIEELADVYITLEQLEIIFNVGLAELRKVEESKLKRLEERVQGEPKKKVFSADKWYEDMVGLEWVSSVATKEEVFEVYDWVPKCDGLTEEEMREIGYSTHDDWMVEV